LPSGTGAHIQTGGPKGHIKDGREGSFQVKPHGLAVLVNQK
jgi:hypothetical protein